MRKKIPQLRQALQGVVRPHQQLILSQLLADIEGWTSKSRTSMPSLAGGWKRSRSTAASEGFDFRGNQRHLRHRRARGGWHDDKLGGQAAHAAERQRLGISLRQGRIFSAADQLDRPIVVIINETMARQFWPGQSPLGKRISIDDPTDPHWRVGIVSDVRFPADAENPDTRLQVYRPWGQDDNFFGRNHCPSDRGCAGANVQHVAPSRC